MTKNQVRLKPHEPLRSAATDIVYSNKSNKRESKFKFIQFLTADGTLKDEKNLIKQIYKSLSNVEERLQKEPNARHQETMLWSQSTNQKPVFLDIAINNDKIGRIELKLYDEIGLMTAGNFRALCIGQNGFRYQRSRFHRIIPQYIIQGGDITNGDGTGNKSIFGGLFDDENFKCKHFKADVVSMANSGPNTNGSQFFITTTATPLLDGNSVVFGEVINGMNVVHWIENYGSPSGTPSANIVIIQCGIIE